MKKVAHILLISYIVICVCALAACGANDSAQYDARQIAEIIVAGLRDAPVLHPLLPDDKYYEAYVSDIYLIDPDALEEGAIYYAGGIEACEISVLKSKDAAGSTKTEAALIEYKERRAVTFTGYAPLQAALVEQGSVVRNGSYTALILCANPQDAEKIFRQCFSAKPPPAPDGSVLAARISSGDPERKKESPDLTYDPAESLKKDSSTAATTTAAQTTTATKTTTAVTTAIATSTAVDTIATSTKVTAASSTAAQATSSTAATAKSSTAVTTTNATTTATMAKTTATAINTASTAVSTTATLTVSTAAIPTAATTATPTATTATATTTYTAATASVTAAAAADNAGAAADNAGAAGAADPDAYDREAILKAWNSGDDSALSEKNKKILDACAAVIDSLITEDMTEYDKELAIHDWMIAWADYDMEAASNAPDAKPDPDNENPYGLLFRKKAICTGYTATFQLFMDMLGIECISVEGTSRKGSEEHGWNMVRLDGDWYCVDVTWDDPVGAKNANQATYHRFFNATSQYLRDYDHQWDESAAPEATATAYSWKPQ